MKTVFYNLSQQNSMGDNPSLLVHVGQLILTSFPVPRKGVKPPSKESHVACDLIFEVWQSKVKQEPHPVVID